MIFGLIWILWSSVRIQKIIWIQTFKKLFTFTFAAAIPYLVTCIVMFVYGVFPEFWFWTVTYALEYGKQLTLSEGLNTFSYQTKRIVSSAYLIWIMSAIGFILLLVDKKLRANSAFIVPLSILSFLSICLGLYFRPHYYVLILPVVAMFAGITISIIQNYFNQKSSHVAIKIIPIILTFLVIIYSIKSDLNIYLRADTYIVPLYYLWCRTICGIIANCRIYKKEHY